MPSVPSLWKITVTCAPGLAGAVEAALAEGAVAVTVLAPPRKATAVVEALYDAKPGKAALNALRVKLAVMAALNKMDSPSPAKTKALRCNAKFSLPLPLSGERGIMEAPQARVEKVGDLDWLKKVAADFPPIQIGRWTVYGGAHENAVKGRRLKLRIDASSAFGTGEHPTTRGCLLMLDRVLKHDIQGNALDLGCGSGILAMAYAKAAHKPAVAADLDPDAVRIARENAHRNGLQAFVSVARARGYNTPVVRAHAPYGLIMANIFARPLCLMAKDLKLNLRPGGIAILSGILNNQANAVLAAHRAQGFALIERLQQGEWTVLMLRRPA